MIVLCSTALCGCTPTISGPVASLKFNGNYTSAKAEIVTDAPLLIPIARQANTDDPPDQRYRAFFQPPGTGSSTISVLFSHPVVEFSRGWVHLRGKQPAAKTTRVYAMAFGSEFVVRIFSVGSLECEWVINMHESDVYVWILPSGPVDLHTLATTTPAATIENGEYWQICSDGSTLGPDPWSADVESFMGHDVSGSPL
jgi:hypothetical protein